MSEAIMIDIETLGTSKNSVILSIGAVQFNEDGVGTEFYVQVDPESCTDFGLVIDARTVLWWMDQNDKARRHLTSTKGETLDAALIKLAQAFNWKAKDLEVWANGVDFDLTILEEAYKAIGMREPWPYWSKMDYCTVKNLVPRSLYEAVKEAPVVAHNALADAMAQAITLTRLQKFLKFEEAAPAKEAEGGEMMN